MSYTAPEINLLAKRKKAFNQQSATALKAKVWAGTILVGYVIVLVLLMTVNVYFSQKVKTTQDALNRAQMSLTSSTVTIKQYEKVIVRAKTIESLFSERRALAQLWQQIRQILPAGTELTMFAVEGNTLKINISAPNVLIANQVIDMVETSVSALGVKSTSVDVTRSGDASYLMSLDMALNTTGKNQKI